MGDFLSERHLQQALANILGDEILDPDEKGRAAELAHGQYERFLDGTDTVPTLWDDGRLVGLGRVPAHVAFAPSVDGECLGNVWTYGGFIRGVAQQLRYNSDEAKRLVDLALRSGKAALSRDETFDLEDMRERVRLRDREVWLFRNEATPTAPYDGAELPNIPCKLGLPYREGDRFVAFEVPAVVVVNGRRPCAYDPDWRFHEFWRPDGRTKCVCGKTPGAEGMLEWVVDAPLLANVRPVLREAVVDDCVPDGVDCYD